MPARPAHLRRGQMRPRPRPLNEQSAIARRATPKFPGPAPAKPSPDNRRPRDEWLGCAVISLPPLRACVIASTTSARTSICRCWYAVFPIREGEEFFVAGKRVNFLFRQPALLTDAVDDSQLLRTVGDSPNEPISLPRAWSWDPRCIKAKRVKVASRSQQ
jgi:hypothetical protein